MKIEKVDVIVTSPGRNFVTLKLTTSDGVVRLGDATLNGRELAVASYLRDHVGGRTHCDPTPSLRTPRRTDPTNPEVARTQTPENNETPAQQGFHASYDT